MGNLSDCGAIIFLVPCNATGTTFVCGNDAASLATPVFPGNRKGFSVFFERVPSGKIPRAQFDSRTSAAEASAKSPPSSL